MARKLIDCQYFKNIDVAIIHEIVDGNRNYQVIKNPNFHYYIEPELKQKKSETKYYKNINELKRVDCKYADLYDSVALNLYGKKFENLDFILDFNLTQEKAKELNEKYHSKERLLMANHNLYGADDQIEYRLIAEYYEKYKDEIDMSIPSNYMFFDIEVHSDFDKNTYLELEKIYHYLNNGTEYEPDLNNIYLEPFKHLMEETDLEKVKEYIVSFSKNSVITKYQDLRFFLALFNSKAREIDKDRVETFMKNNLTKDKLNFIYDNIGFPDENKGNNRVDAISFVDVTKRKLYMYLLNVQNDLKEKSDREYIINEKYVQNDLFNFVELFLIVSYLTNIDSKNKEACKELIDELPFLTSMYKSIDIKNKEDKEKVASLIEKAKTIIPNYNEIVKMDVEYKLFDSELVMIKEFFNKIKTEIKPSIIAAHNAKFDINTLKNRLIKFGESFDFEINQLTTLNEPILNNIESDIRIDMLTMERKKEKTKYFCPGIVLLDTLLLYAKSVSGEKNWSLDSIANEELNDSKISYDFPIHEFYARKVKTFIKYSSVDTLLLMRLEEKLEFISLFQLILSNSKTGWNSYMYRTTYLTNLIKYELMNRKDGFFVARNNLTFLNPKKEKTQGSTKEVSYKGAYNTTLDGICDSYGFHENLFDLDFSAFYPSCALTTNLCVDQLLFTTEQKELHNDYIFMSKIAFGNKYLNLPSSEEIFKSI